MGDLTDLAELGAWLKELGDGLLGTLPLLAGFLEKSLIEPSPYAPISRLAWNELYVDTGRHAAAPSSSGGSRSRLIDYEQTYASKRRSISEAVSAARESRIEGRHGAILRQPFRHVGLLQILCGLINHREALARVR